MSLAENYFLRHKTTGATFLADTEYETYSSPYLYTFVTTPKTWIDAKSECEAKRAVLVKIDSNATKDLILQNFPRGHSALWIGANDIATEGTWKWVADGSSAQAQSDWLEGQPGDRENDDCVTIDYKGKWNDLDCSSCVRGFVCQKQTVIIDRYLLSFSYDMKTRTLAQLECAKDGYHLVKVDSNLLTEAIIQNSGAVERWIGASQVNSEGNWVWFDGSSARKTTRNYHSWSREAPNGGITEDCAVVRHDGRWYDISCSQERKYICQKSMIIFIENFQLTFPLHKATWDQANATCTRNGSNLLYTRSLPLELVARNLNERAWIGLSYIPASRQWKWLDGFAARDRRRHHHPNHHCAFTQPSSGTWFSGNCSTPQKFICQKRFSKDALFNNNRYIFYRRNDFDFNVAEYFCAYSNMSLAEIHDEETYRFLRSQINNPDAEFYCRVNVTTRSRRWDRRTDTRRPVLTMNGWKEVYPTKKLAWICEQAPPTKITLSKSNQTIGAGSDEEVICSADGIPFSEVFWKFSSKSVSLHSNDAVFQLKGKGTSVLYFENATLIDEGIYTCVAKSIVENSDEFLTDEFHLTVPSTPEYVIAEGLECSTNITVKWKANARARDINYRFALTNTRNACEISEVWYYLDETFSIEIGKSKMAIVTMTPCPNDVCKDNYSKSTNIQYSTVGCPEKVENLQVQLLNKYFCALSWKKSSEYPPGFITYYKVIIMGKRNQLPSVVEPSDSERTREVLINGNETKYITVGKPNFEYKIGIQAKTYKGFDDILWPDTSCVTEASVNPEIQGCIKEDGTLDVMIDIPSQRDDDVRCKFVIVRVHNNDQKVINDYTRNDLVRANSSSNEYIALAFDIKTASEFSKLKMTLGEKQNTTCELSFSEKSAKRATISSVFLGRNWKLDQHSNYSIFTVTAFSINREILLTTSECVMVSAIPKGKVKTHNFLDRPTLNRDSEHISWIYIGVTAGSVTLLLLILFGVCLKRTSKFGSSSDAVVQKKSATTNETATTSFCSQSQRDDKAQSNDGTEVEAKSKAVGKKNLDQPYIEINEYPNPNPAYQFVKIHRRQRVPPYSTCTAIAPNTFRLEERPEGYDSINIPPRQDRSNHEYSNATEPNYEHIDVTEMSP